MAVCQFFVKGQCRFGDSCRNEHPGPAKDPSQQGGFGGGGNDEPKLTLPFSASSISKDLTPHIDKPMWPLSSYAPSKHEPLLVPGLDKSPEELRVKAAAAVASGNIKTYLKYEEKQMAAADQMYLIARNNSTQTYDQAVKQRELSARLAALTNTQTTTSASGNNINPTSASALSSTKNAGSNSAQSRDRAVEQSELPATLGAAKANAQTPTMASSASGKNGIMAPHIDCVKPMWPLSSYALLMPGLDKSPEELRVEAVAAMASGSINAYLEYEKRQIAAAEKMYENACKAHAYDEMVNQRESPDCLAAVLLAENTPSAFGYKGIIVPHTDDFKPLWPLSSYARYVRGLDESPEELRLKAVAAVASWNTNSYKAYEKMQVAAADQMFVNLNAGITTSPEANDEVVKKSELPAVTNAQTTSAFWNNVVNLTFASSTFPNPNPTAPPSAQPAFRSTFAQSAFGQAVQNPFTSTTSTVAAPTGAFSFKFGQRQNNTAPVFTSGQTPPGTSSAFGQQRSVLGQLTTSSPIEPASEAFRAFNNTGSTGAFGNNLSSAATNTGGGGVSAFATQPSVFSLAAQTVLTAGLELGQILFGEPTPATSVPATASRNPVVASTSVRGGRSGSGVLPQHPQQPAQQGQQQQTAPVSLSLGSTVEHAVQQAILVDKENGYSQNSQDSFLQAITSPLGRMFYTDTSKQVQDIHEEALRIIELKKNEKPSPTSKLTTDDTSTAGSATEPEGKLSASN